MFQYSEEDGVYLAELGGIEFICEKPSGELEEAAKELADCYEDQLPEVAAYILPELTEAFEGLTAERLLAALGKPQIDLDAGTITYLEQALDESHIFVLEFDGALEEFLEFSMDG